MNDILKVFQQHKSLLDITTPKQRNVTQGNERQVMIPAEFQIRQQKSG